MKTGEDYIGSHEKRAFDVLGASLLVVAAAPIAGGAALALCMEDRCLQPIFRQSRVGRQSQPFLVNKLRTMIGQDTEGFLDTFGPEDPRASRLGKLVRKMGIDEIPQALNILSGDMSLVGIRPQVPEVLEQRASIDSGLFDEWYYCYERNPGLFGAGQAYAHTVGYYKENGEAVRTIMKLDIEAYHLASLQGDLTTVLRQPIELIQCAFRSSESATV